MKRYICRKCGYSFDLASKGYGTADVKGHCGKVMDVTEINEQGPKQPLDEKDAEIERLRLGITIARGCIIGALAGGHMDGEYSGEYGKNVLRQIAEALGIDISESVK